MDGAFDLTHFGHANAFRQARACGTHLVVGVNDSASITKCKGAPLMSDAERLAAVRGCRFVDEVVEAVPYVMDDEYVRHIVEAHRIDLIVHGDDPCVVDGRDVYEAAQRLGKYRTIPRTEGISTTEIIGRVLGASSTSGAQPQPQQQPKHNGSPPPKPSAAAAEAAADAARRSHFWMTTSALQLFAGTAPPARGPQPQLASASSPCAAAAATSPEGAAAAAAHGSVRVVYVDGSFDMFHAGHVSVLRQARALGDRLLVGVHADATVRALHGPARPIMCRDERVLSVLACGAVDDVLLDPPWQIDREMITALGLAVVVRPLVEDEFNTAGPAAGARPGSGTAHAPPPLPADVDERYVVARALDVYTELRPEPGLRELGASRVVGRIRERQPQMASRYAAKAAAERAHAEARMRQRDETRLSAS